MSVIKSLQNFSDATPPTGVVTDAFSSSDYRGGNGFWFFNPDGSSRYFSYSGHDSAIKAYQRCAPVTAIINKKAQAFINGKTWLLNTMGKPATSGVAKKITNLLKKPNPLQSEKAFQAQGYIYQQMFGFNMILPIKPVGFDENVDATYLWNIPPYMLDIKETKKLFYQSDTNGIIEKIVLNYKGQKTILQAKDVYFIKDFTVSMDSLVIPESRMKSLELPINNIIGAYESRNVLINYRGALGILSNDSGSGQYGGMPLDEQSKEELQNDFKRYGLSKHQWKVIITSASMKWQQMGYATKDLMLFEEIEGSTMAICDAYSFPYRLLAAEKSASYNDVKEFNKQLYQDGIIPESENIFEQWHAFFDLDKYNLQIQKDFSHIPILQDDEQAKATARKTRNDALEKEFRYNLIPLNRWLELNGEDPLPAAQGAIYFSDFVKLYGDPMKAMQSINLNTQNQDGNGNSNTETGDN